MLDAIARALLLDDTERTHLFDLARAADGIPLSGRPRRRSTKSAGSRPSLHWVLNTITDGVAFVRDQHQDLLATNELGRVFYAPLIGAGGRTPNLARFQFLDPASRDFYPDWELFAQMCVAIMRAEAGRDPNSTTSLVSSPRAVTYSGNCGARMTSGPTGLAQNDSTTLSSAKSLSPTKNSSLLPTQAASS